MKLDLRTFHFHYSGLSMEIFEKMQTSLVGISCAAMNFAIQWSKTFV